MYLSRYDFAIKIAEIFELDKSLIRPVKSSEHLQKAMRPLKAGLAVEMAKNLLTTRLLGVEESLKLLRAELNFAQ